MYTINAYTVQSDGIVDERGANAFDSLSDFLQGG